MNTYNRKYDPVTRNRETFFEVQTFVSSTASMETLFNTQDEEYALREVSAGWNKVAVIKHHWQDGHHNRTVIASR